MSIKKINKESTGAGYVETFVLDSAADAQFLPDANPGSTAIVAVKDGPIYMVNASGAWEEL